MIVILIEYLFYFQIVAVESTDDVCIIKERFKGFQTDEIILTEGQFLMPGFIDAHIHAPQFPNLGIGYDVPLLEWLDIYTFPLESKYQDDNFAKNIYSAVVVSK